MRIISKAALRGFWESRKQLSAIAERDLSTWHKLASRAAWSNFAMLKQTFGAADQVRNCVVFDAGNNRFRVIGRVNYNKGILYILKVMDHDEYDTSPWAEKCGCYDPPPQKSVTRNGESQRKAKPHLRKHRRANDARQVHQTQAT